jgi:hypothetical protein
MEKVHSWTKTVRFNGRINGPNGIRNRVTDVRVPSAAFLTESHGFIYND